MKHFLLLLAVMATVPLPAAIVKRTLNPNANYTIVPTADLEWKPWQKGFTETPEGFLCDNGDDQHGLRGLGKAVFLNQERPQAFRVMAESKAEKASFGNDRDYSLYLDISHTDGTNEWGVVSAFSAGTHGWEQREITYMPSKPVQVVNCWLLFRSHSGKAWFRNLQVFQAPHMPNSAIFDTVPVFNERPANGWILRDVKNNSNFVSIENQEALGVQFKFTDSSVNGAQFHTAELSIPDLKEDRILHLAYVQRLPDNHDWQWLDFERIPKAQIKGEYSFVSSTGCGAAASNSNFPMGAVGEGSTGYAMGMDLHTPAHGRVVYNTEARELFVAYDIALTPENNTATVKLFQFEFAGRQRLRNAIAKLYQIYPEAFQTRIKKQGLWMAFAPISKVEGFEDFGFAVKEGYDETAWDDAHGILTFRYTEPMTMWMHMPKEMPKTYDQAVAEALRQEKEAKPGKHAKTFSSSVHFNKDGKPAARLLDTPWCNGAVWSMNSMPNIKGEDTDFSVKWNDAIKKNLYGPNAKGVMDGEYIDSSEGYVTDILDYNRAHFSAARTPLTYDAHSLKVGIFRGLISYEYIHAIEQDIHAMGKLMMANSTPNSIWYFVPLLDYLGTESNWNYHKKWTQPTDSTLIYRRALCAGKPYCFLQNTDFDFFDHAMVERYMKTTLFYGMYPSFFSADASTKHYFKNPALYNRDRDLFKKYVPLCKLVGEAGWRPETQAVSSNQNIWVEQYGDRYFTLFNNTAETASGHVSFTIPGKSVIDHVTGKTYKLNGTSTPLFSIDPSDVMLLEVIK